MSEKEKFYRLSTVTGKTYNVFDDVKLLNIYQCIYYMENNIFPDDIKITMNEKGNKCLVFYYNKEDTQEIYAKWQEEQRKRADKRDIS